MGFQGAWTDPVPGLQYKRERFYDPRNASWLSQDPMGDQDSPEPLRIRRSKAAREDGSAGARGFRQKLKR